MSHPNSTEPKARRGRRWLLIVPLILLIALALAGGAFVAWASTTTGDLLPEVDAALTSGAGVTVSDEGEWITFTPEGGAPSMGVIYYPGGRVLPEAYTPFVRRFADAGYLAVTVRMPLNLAVLAPGRAADVIAAYPDITDWVIVGHSLGGAMAANFAKANPGSVDGLVLLASYPASFDSLAEAQGLIVASVYASEDGLAAVESVEDSAQYLPADTVFVRIEGGNHAQFGHYGDQPGDNPATISRDEQQQQAFEAALAVLTAVEG
jgi:dienelactone hydrolase